MQLHHVLTRLLLILALLPMTTLSATEYELRTIATGLDKPWSIAAIDGDALLVTEKAGRLIRIDATGGVTTIGGTPGGVLRESGRAVRGATRS